MSHQKLRSIRFANEPRFLITIFFAQSAAGAAGPSAEQMGDSETGESASLLVRESEVTTKYTNYTKVQKRNGARPVPGLEAFLQVRSQASLRMSHQKLRSIRLANNPVSRWFFYFWRGALFGAARPLAERERRWGLGIPCKLACEGI